MNYYIAKDTENNTIEKFSLPFKLNKENYPEYEEVTKEEFNNIKFKVVSLPSIEEINKQIISKIREKYTIDDEFQMQRLGLQDSSNTEYQEYLTYVNQCVEWGRLEKEKHGLI